MFSSDSSEILTRGWLAYGILKLFNNNLHRRRFTSICFHAVFCTVELGLPYNDNNDKKNKGVLSLNRGSLIMADVLERFSFVLETLRERLVPAANQRS